MVDLMKKLKRGHFSNSYAQLVFLLQNWEQYGRGRRAEKEGKFRPGPVVLARAGEGLKSHAGTGETPRRLP